LYVIFVIISAIFVNHKCYWYDKDMWVNFFEDFPLFCISFLIPGIVTIGGIKFIQDECKNDGIITKFIVLAILFVVISLLVKACNPISCQEGNFCPNDEETNITVKEKVYKKK